jgi:hypothetical protein
VFVNEFVEDTVEAYDHRLVRLEGSMRAALQPYLGTDDGTVIEVLLAETRKNDGERRAFDASSW